MTQNDDFNEVEHELPADEMEGDVAPDVEAPQDNNLSQRERRRQEKAARKPTFMRSALEFLLMLAAALVVTWCLKLFVVQPFTIPTGSMEPTIAVGDYVLSERVSYYFGTPRAGDIVTFADPTGSVPTLIKRCIATEGQTVDLRNGFVFVDGVQLDEPYVYGKPSDPLPKQFQGVTITYPYTVPEGYLWVMGDNRTNSNDSRFFGPILASSVSGHAFFTYWPISQFGVLE